MQQKIVTIYLLGLILFLGLFVRVYDLSAIPSGFFADEASIGYNAYSILTTGKDEYGVSFPIFFQSFGDWRHPIAIYATIPFTIFFGLNEISVRLQSVFFGLITIIILYLLGKQMISKNFGLLLSFLGTVNPWLIHYNRTGFEFSSYAALFLLSFYFLIKTTSNRKYIIPFFIASGFTIYTYQPAKLIVPLFVISALIIFRKTFLQNLKESSIGFLTFLLLTIPLAMSFVDGNATARFNQVSVLSPNLTTGEVIIKVVSHFIIQLSPSYLFWEGEPTFITRHFTNGFAPLLLFSLPFVFLGIISVLKKIKDPLNQMFLAWLALFYPLAGMLVSDAPFTSRAIIGAPLFVILAGLGIHILITQRFIIGHKIQKIVISIIISIFIANFVVFLHFYFTRYPLYSSDFWGWQYGPKDVISYFIENEKNYDDLYMEGAFNAPEIFLKFYSPDNCKRCRIGVPQDRYDPSRKQLFALTPLYIQEHNVKLTSKKIIYYPNNTVAFQIGEIVQ